MSLKQEFAPREAHFFLTLLHPEWPKLYGVLAVLSAIGLRVDLFEEDNSKGNGRVASPVGTHHINATLSDCACWSGS